MVAIFILMLALSSLGNFGLCSNEDEMMYDNYQLIVLTPSDEKQVALLYNFPDPTEGVQVLKQSRGLYDTLDLLVPPNRVTFVTAYARDNNIKAHVKHENFRRSLEASLHSTSRRALRGFDLFAYNNYDNMLEFMERLSEKYPDCVKLQTVGESYEQRPLRLAKISSKPAAKNPIIFVDAGVHAREWVAPAMALYLIKKLSESCELPADDPKSMLGGVDWYILPAVNPDGYEFSRINNRMWRKTRSRTSRSCYGVDGNRNYGFHWGVSGVSKDPCDPQTYPGSEPFSEAETRAVRDIMLNNAAKIKLYVSLHAYGQYIVYPWGYTGDYLPQNWRDLDKLARSVSNAVVKAGGEPFKVMSAGKWYAAAGGSDDYAFGAVKIPYSFTMELTNGHEFVFPEDDLRDVLPTIYEGFKVFQQHIRRKFH